MQPSTKLWQRHIFKEESIQTRVQNRLHEETPSVLTAILERTCNLHCQHCLYQKEGSSIRASMENSMRENTLNLAEQLPRGANDTNPSFLHSGRICQPWHIEIFKEVQERRPDVELGIIENGSYTRLLDKFREEQVTLDWMDVSLDGTKESHNANRDPEHGQSYDQTINGLTQARQIVPGGTVSSLMTLQHINYEDILDVAEVLFQENPAFPEHDLADEFHLTFMTPEQPRNHEIDLDDDQVASIWEDVKTVVRRYREDRERVFFKVYGHHHLAALAKSIGPSKMLKAFEDAEYNTGSITLTIDKTPIHYYPYSLWPQECMLIDADATQRLAHCQTKTLDELHRPENQDFTVQRLRKDLSYEDAHHDAVNQWWEAFGKDFLSEEKAVFDRLKKQAKPTIMV